MQKSSWVQTLLKLHPSERVKNFGKEKCLQIKRRTKQYYLQRQRRLQTPNQLIQLCNINNIYTIKQMIEYNKTHQEKISLSSVRYWFGTWTCFKRRLQLKSPTNAKFVQSQVIDLCVRFNIQTLTDFQDCHKKQPILFPSSDWIERHFGRWKYFKKILQSCSVQKTLQKYVDLKSKLGRYPSKMQCRKNGVDVQLLLSVWSPIQFKQTVQILQRVYKNAKK